MTDALFAKAKTKITRNLDKVPKPLKSVIASMKLKSITKNGKNIISVSEFIDKGMSSSQKGELKRWFVMEQDLDKNNFLVSSKATIT
jgi:hypothetical protein